MQIHKAVVVTEQLVSGKNVQNLTSREVTKAFLSEKNFQGPEVFHLEEHENF